MTLYSKQILGFLHELDGKLFLKKPLDLYVIGGSAITLAFDPENRTSDIDLIDAPDSLIKLGGEHSALADKYQIYLSSLAEINFSVPSDWRKHVKPFSKFKNFILLIPPVEDIVLGKLARLEPKDFEDIFSLLEKGFLDQKKFLKRLNENTKELEQITYRNNAKLFFQEVFRKKLTFVRGKALLS